MSWKLNSELCILDGQGATLFLQTTDKASAEAAIDKLVSAVKARIQSAMASLPELKRLHRLLTEQAEMRPRGGTSQRSTHRAGQHASPNAHGSRHRTRQSGSRSLTYNPNHSRHYFATDPAALDSEIGDLRSVLLDRFKSLCSAVVREQKSELLAARQKVTRQANRRRLTNSNGGGALLWRYDPNGVKGGLGPHVRRGPLVASLRLLLFF